MTCLLLEGGLPETIDGVPIYADYRNMIRFEQILDDDSLTDVQKTMLGVSQLFDELPPGGLERAVDRLQWFYSRGKAASEEDGQQGGKKAVRAYDLTYDADASCIYAAFRQAYHIDLIEIPYLHWWTCGPRLGCSTPCCGITAPAPLSGSTKKCCPASGR